MSWISISISNICLQRFPDIWMIQTLIFSTRCCHGQNSCLRNAGKRRKLNPGNINADRYWRYQAPESAGDFVVSTARVIYRLPRVKRGVVHFNGHSPCSSRTCRTRKRSATCVWLYLRFLLLKGFASGILNCSPSLSSSNWCLIYSAIRAVFLPTVST